MRTTLFEVTPTPPGRCDQPKQNRGGGRTEGDLSLSLGARTTSRWSPGLALSRDLPEPLIVTTTVFERACSERQSRTNAMSTSEIWRSSMVGTIRMIVTLLVTVAVGISAGQSGYASVPGGAPTEILVATPREAMGDVHDAECGQAVPPEGSLEHVGSTSPTVPLEVLVVYERVDQKEVRTAMETAAEAYGILGIRLVTRYRSVSVPNLKGDTQAYLEWLQEKFGGKRPKGVDVVYLATHRYLDYTGLAACIGGIASPEHAFAVGMLKWDVIVGIRVNDFEPPRGSPVKDGAAKVAVHEIGHLLGGQHEFGQCGASVDPADPAYPCDVMLPVFPQQVGLRFGPINASLVRYFAVNYAKG